MDKGKLAGACVVWLVIIASGAMIYKWWFVPSQEQAAQQAKQELRDKILTETGADSRYDHVINFGLDGFSGYSVIRSKEFVQQLANQRIKLNLIDDGGDYPERISLLRDGGGMQMAAFTIDALLNASSGTIPVTIVAMIDETRGADAMVSYKPAIPSLDALNHKDTKFVLTPDSPAETLARVVMAHFNLTNLSSDPFVKCKDAEEVYKKYRTAKPDERQVFVLWEPYVTKILENPNTHRVLDSSRFKGYIVDVIVVNRNYLYANKDVVSKFVESYFRANYDLHEKMVDVVLQDAKEAGTPLTQKQAEALVNGVWWKNTQENYCHFGLQEGGNLQHIEDIITNITSVLIKTGGINSDPTGGKPNLLYYPDILSEMKSRGFHPGVEDIRDDKTVLPALTDNQWNTLQPVGTLAIPQLVFARGTSKLLSQSQRVLDGLAENLNSWPYYVLIKGDASRRGDLAANKALALARAEAAREYLVQKGINPNRIRAIAVEPSGVSAVNFVLGQLPY